MMRHWTDYCSPIRLTLNWPTRCQCCNKILNAGTKALYRSGKNPTVGWRRGVCCEDCWSKLKQLPTKPKGNIHFHD